MVPRACSWKSWRSRSWSCIRISRWKSVIWSCSSNRVVISPVPVYTTSSCTIVRRRMYSVHARRRSRCSGRCGCRSRHRLRGRGDDERDSRLAPGRAGPCRSDSSTFSGSRASNSRGDSRISRSSRTSSSRISSSSLSYSRGPFRVRYRLRPLRTQVRGFMSLRGVPMWNSCVGFGAAAAPFAAMKRSSAAIRSST